MYGVHFCIEAEGLSKEYIERLEKRLPYLVEEADRVGINFGYITYDLEELQPDEE